MQNIEVTKSIVNVAGLDAELRNNLGDVVKGVSVRRGQVIVHLDDRVTAAQVSQAQQIVLDHDASQRTPEQSARQQLEADRKIYRQLFDPASINLQQLAERVAWLENEIRDLRGL
jgi:multidrug efflux pump subunit AcrA (membrane-fusion protein)